MRMIMRTEPDHDRYRLGLISDPDSIQVFTYTLP